jgi:hypothetical protein
VKWPTHLRLLAAPLLAVLLLASAPPAQGAALRSPLLDYFRLKEKPKEKPDKPKDKPKDSDDKGRNKASVPEGSGGAALVLAAAALTGGLVLSRRKRGAKEV